MSMRRAASCAQPLQRRSAPRGARTTRAPWVSGRAVPVMGCLSLLPTPCPGPAVARSGDESGRSPYVSPPGSHPPGGRASLERPDLLLDRRDELARADELDGRVDVRLELAVVLERWHPPAERPDGGGRAPRREKRRPEVV